MFFFCISCNFHFPTYHCCASINFFPSKVASMVKWTKIVLWYTKAMVFLGQRSKGCCKVLFEMDSFSWSPLLCGVEYSNVEYQIEIFKTRQMLKVMLKSKWLSKVLDVNFTTLSILKLDFFFHIPWLRYPLRASSQNFVEKPSILCNFIVFWTSFRQMIVRYHLLAHHLHRLLKYVDFSWNYFCHNKLLSFVDQYVS